MYTLYIANKHYSSWSLRPWILMRALDIAFEERLVPFKGAVNAEQFRRFSPSGRVPCLHDDDGTVVWDSLAIVEYLAERHPSVWPADRPTRAWARSAAAEMHSGFMALRTYCSMAIGLRVELREQSEGLLVDVRRLDELWAEGRARFGGPYLAGHRFTAVDAFYAPVVFRIQTYGLPVGGDARAYTELMLDEPAMREWHAAALAEPWRDETHDREVATYGTIVADHRAAAG